MARLHPVLASWQLPSWYVYRGENNFKAFTSRRMRRMVRHCLRRAAAWEKVCTFPNGFQLLDLGEAMNWRRLAHRSAGLLHLMRSARLYSDGTAAAAAEILWDVPDA